MRWLRLPFVVAHVAEDLEMQMTLQPRLGQNDVL